MTNNQINILIEHGEIKSASIFEAESAMRSKMEFPDTVVLTPIDYRPAFTEYEFFDNDIQESFRISYNLFAFLEILFEWYLEIEIEREIDGLKSELNQKEPRFGPGKKLRQTLYEAMILERNKEFDGCFLKPDFNKTGEGQKKMWKYYLIKDESEETQKNLTALIEGIKDKIFDWQPVKVFQKNEIPVLTCFKFNLLRRYFYSSGIEKVFKVCALDASIKYLQDLMNGLDVSEKNESTKISQKNGLKITNRSHALAHIYKIKANIEKDISRREIYEKFPESVAREFYSIGYLGGHPKIVLTVDDIKRAIILLQQENCIEALKIANLQLKNLL